VRRAASVGRLGQSLRVRRGCHGRTGVGRYTGTAAGGRNRPARRNHPGCRAASGCAARLRAHSATGVGRQPRGEFAGDRGPYVHQPRACTPDTGAGTGRPHAPTHADPCRRILARDIRHLVEQADSAGVQLAACLVTIVEAALPNVPAELALRLLATLSGHRARADHIAAEAKTIIAARQAAAEHSERMLIPVATRKAAVQFAAVEWPAARRRDVSPPPFEPLRGPDSRPTAGRLFSAKLQRDVAYESALELRQMQDVGSRTADRVVLRAARRRGVRVRRAGAHLITRISW
jgi:hypothetical protein